MMSQARFELKLPALSTMTQWIKAFVLTTKQWLIFLKAFLNVNSTFIFLLSKKVFYLKLKATEYKSVSPALQLNSRVNTRRREV